MYQTVDSTVAGDEVRFEDFREVKENMQLLAKKFRDLEGDHVFGSAAKEMCLVSGLVIPAKFKTPDFEKYKGHTCPKSHLIMYYRKMAAHVEDDKLMIHCFQDSLSGAPSKWYLSLDQNRIRCFQDLSDAFIKHYKYNMDMAPDRRQLQSMFQHDKESFKEYAQRWRELASQVEPPLAEKELAELFIDTKWQLAVVAGTSNANQKKFSRGFPRKKEGEINVVTVGQGRAPPRRRPQQYPPQQYAQQPFPYQQPMYPVQYAPQPYVAAVTPTFTQQPAQAYQAPLVYRPAPVQQRAAVPPAYQQAPAAPVYQQPRAQAPRQNAQNQNRRQGDRATFNPIPMTYTELYPSLLQKGLVVPRPMGPPPDRLPPWYNPNAYCPFHEGAPGHDLEGCYTLKHRVRELIESKILSFKDMGPNVKNNPLPPHGYLAVNAIEDASVGVTVDKVDDVKTPLAAFHARLVEAGLINVNHDNCEECAIYPRGCQVVRDNIQDLMDKGVLQISSVAKNEDVLVIEPCFNLPEPIEIPYYSGGVVLVNRMSRMTRSGRIYTPKFNVTPQGSAKESTVVAPTKEPEVVQSEDAVEFLKEALLKVLAQAHVTQNITVDQFDGVVANITACNTLSFIREELPEDGQNHNRALHISVKCKDDALARVLVDTGSSLNVMPKRTLAKLSYQGPAMKPSALIVKAFDGSRRTVIGEVELPILIGPHVFPNNFQVMDINPAYSCLLGHPWIHAVGAVTFTLHQKMKYIEADEDALETSFQPLEIANATFVEMKDPVGKACSSFASLKSVKSSIEGGNPEGWGQLIDIREKHDRFGLGYVPSAAKGARVPTKDNTRSIQEVFLST
ncbi:uncharacterized protein LOC127078874 [Lathyrus oleraceus]|uniref:uncharacterized protein LOC127078874 n=1 Tax=Pisum sativum TaxID=3888 RepID=UPI0021CE0FE4|nr:uncharacterized protein LOC127078874 [Pisum sativum]